MNSNYKLVKKIFAEVNDDCGYSKYEGLCILGSEVTDTLYIGFGAELLLKINEGLLESFDNPFDVFIYYFYTYNEKAQSMEKAKCYEGYLNKKFDEILKSDDEDEILLLVENSKRVKRELDALQKDLEWTKEVGKLLYTSKELFNRRVEETLTEDIF